MNDETIEASEEAGGPLGGERLRAARRKNDISIGDIAKELHLDEPKVRALERNEFDVLGAPVFAKGHLRKYADLVGVPVDDVMTDYYRMNRSAGAPPVVGPKRKRTRDVSLGPWLGGSVAAIVIAAAAYWWFTYEPAAPQSVVQPSTLAPFSSGEEQGPIVTEEQAPAEDVDATGSDTAPVAAETPPVALVSPAVSSSSAGLPSTAPQVEMVLSFSGDCWTEVSDASGQRLYYDLGQAGKVVTLSGDAPLRVILGDSANASITVNGRNYPIPASARSGRLARVDINRP